MPDTLDDVRVRARRWVRLGASLVWLVVVLAYVLDVVFLFLNAANSKSELGPLIQAVEDFPFAIVATLGLLILRSQPFNQVGWWMMMAGLSFPLEGLASEILVYGARNWGESGLVSVAGWVSGWSWLGGQLSIPFILLFYPDGRLPSRRWWPVATLFWAVAISSLGLFAFAPWTDAELGVSNPFGIEVLAGLEESAIQILAALLTILPLLGTVSLVFRFRNGDAITRLQVKFIALLAIVSIVFFAGLQFVEIGPVIDVIFNIVFSLFAAGTIAAAIVRYRLFDIDRLISRTISYTVLVGVLGLVYFALVALVTTWLDFDSSLAVAGTTLVVAALFNPMRLRLQAWVDRRFNRSRYDAVMVLDRFAERVRGEVGVHRLSEDLKESVTEAMQPSFASVWLAER